MSYYFTAWIKSSSSPCCLALIEFFLYSLQAAPISLLSVPWKLSDAVSLSHDWIPLGFNLLIRICNMERLWAGPDSLSSWQSGLSANWCSPCSPLRQGRMGGWNCFLLITDIRSDEQIDALGQMKCLIAQEPTPTDKNSPAVSMEMFWHSQLYWNRQQHCESWCY